MEHINFWCFCVIFLLFFYTTPKSESLMAEATRRVIVITRNGKTTVMSGWQAWVLGAAILLGAWCALALIVFILVGVAITVGVLLLLLIPALAIAALLGLLMRREP